MKVTTDACLFGAWAVGQIIQEKISINNCLDIGTGTGLLSLMLAQKTDVDIEAIELDEDAAAQAAENLSACAFRNSINIRNADVRKYHFEKKYDVLISNPPFYENELKSISTKKNTAHHSENLLMHELLDIIKNNLSPAGYFFLLLPFKRNEEIRELMTTFDLNLHRIVLVRQSVLHDYFRLMLMGSNNNGNFSETQFDELAIWDERRNYTEEFVRLLQDYYLYL